MTQKRFRVVCCVTDWYIEDKLISPFAVLTPHQASDLLNELYNENEQLKQRNEFLKKQLDRVCDENEIMGDKLKQIGGML